MPYVLGRKRRPPGAEDADVGVPEAVDRLRLVADREQVVALERLQHVELQPVGVLELVDHDQAEPLRPAAAGPGVGREQVAHVQLEVLEVDARPRRLGGGVRAGEAVEQVVEQREDRAGVVVGARRVEVDPGVAIGGARLLLERLGPGRELGGIERARRGHVASRRRQRVDRLQGVERARRGCVATRRGEPVDRLEGVERGGDPRAVRRRGPDRRGRGRRRGAQGGRVGGRPGRRELQARPASSAAAQRGVGARDHGLEVAAVDGRDVHRRRAVRRRPVLERRLERGRGDPPRRALVEHGEARVQPGRERVGAQDARAEAVDRADPGRVDRPGVLVLAQLREPPPDPLAQLRGRLLREGQGENRADRDAVEPHRLDEALDHDGGLARARARGEQRGAVAVADGRPLLRREAAGRRRGRGGGGGRHAGSSTFGSPARQMPG